MSFAARTLVDAFAGPAAVADQDGRILVANLRWGGPPEGATLHGADDGCPAHEQLLSAVRETGAAGAAVTRACRCAGGEGTRLRVTNLESTCGDHRRLIVAESDGPAADPARAFLALLGHEVRTPVTTVVATVDLLRAQALPAEVRETVDTVYRAVHSLRTLTDDLLDLARLETGRLQLDERPMSVRTVLEGVVEPLQQQTREKGILLLAAPAPDMPAAVEGDPDRLSQVLAVVVGNAVKYTERGQVVVTACRDGDTTYVIDVSDTGPGIPAEHRERVFAPFVQVDSSAARRHEGAGLGLALAVRLTERMGGTMTVESEPGAGSLFRIRLPLRPTAESPAVVPVRRKVAVVAPSPRCELALTWLLASAGAEAVPARLDEVMHRSVGPDTVLWCDDAHDPAAVERADAIIAALGPAGRALMISTTDPRTGVVRRPGVLTAPLVLSRLAAALNQERSGRRGAPVTVAPLSGGRVLLAEDNDVNRTVFRRMIELMDVECDTVADGSAAVDALLGGTTYHLALMDVQMPGMDGLAATRAVRAAGCTVPILALTATALAADRDRCLAAGMSGYLTKPITLPELRRALEPHLTAPPGEPAAADALDLDQLIDLENQLEGRELVEMTVTTFLAELDGRCQALATALAAHDHAKLRAVAHTLKSSSALLGARRLADACLRVERQAQAVAEIGELATAVAEIDGAVAVTAAAMRDYLANGEGAGCAAR